MPALYPIRAVAKLTGLPVDTLRAWERRYRAVTPGRGTRGRMYSDVEVRRLMLLRTAVDGGHAIGQVAALSDTELQDLAQTPYAANGKRTVQTGPGNFAPELQPILDAVIAFDYAGTNDELSKLALLLSPTALVHKAVLPLMRLVGESWENGTLEIAQEHMFTSCLRNLLGGLVRLQRPGSGAARMMLTTPPNEQHEFGILAAAMLAVAEGFQVAYLGPNLPAGEILSAAKKFGANVVVLGIMKTNAAPAVKRDMAWLTSELPAAMELWAGGTGAAEVFGGVKRDGAFVLEDMVDLERHLARWKAATREPAQ